MFNNKWVAFAVFLFVVYAVYVTQTPVEITKKSKIPISSEEVATDQGTRKDTEPKNIEENKISKPAASKVSSEIGEKVAGDSAVATVIEHVVAPYIQEQIDSQLAQKNLAKTPYGIQMMGLKIFDKAVGQGKEAKKDDIIQVTLTAWKMNGENHIDNRVVDFTLSGYQIAKGINDGILGMKVGGKRTIIIPPQLLLPPPRSVLPMAFPASEVVIFDVELNQIVEKTMPPSGNKKKPVVTDVPKKAQ